MSVTEAENSTFNAQSASIFAATVALGLITGFFYAYEVSVMRGFAILPDRDFIASMQAVNATVRNMSFAPSFFGAAFLAALAALLHMRQWNTPKALCIFAATNVYIIGGLILTMQINVPLNQWLADLGPASAIPDPAAVRLAYEPQWVLWNLIRTINSTIAFILMATALWLDGRR